ncbi:MAG: PDZ domain-containing protein [Bacteroidales bacterium]|nr:PDZ domain-containing protein [Bacteroidales bacterium]
MVFENTPPVVTIERNSENMDIALPGDFVQSMLANNIGQLAYPIIPAVVDSVIPESSAEEVGIQKGDRIIEINNEPVSYFSDVVEKVGKFKDKGLNIKVQRNYDTLSYSINKPKKRNHRYSP